MGSPWLFGDIKRRELSCEDRYRFDSFIINDKQ